MFALTPCDIRTAHTQHPLAASSHSIMKGTGQVNEAKRPRSRVHAALLLLFSAALFATVLTLSRRSQVTLFQASVPGLVGHRVKSLAEGRGGGFNGLAGARAAVPGSGVSAQPLGSQSTSNPVLLYAASYDGTITTLSLEAANASSQSGGYALEALSTSDGCRTSPSWLTLDASKSVLYCADEGLTSDNGSVSSFSVADDGSLDLLDRIELIKGPVSAAIYGRDDDGLAVAQ